MGNRNGRPWPLLLIAASAAAAIWSGWVGLGELCGFGIIHPLPGIAPGFQINAAITLPVSVEAYGAYALGAWMRPETPKRARKFARRSAIGALAYGAAGQVAYHLLAAAGATSAPWPVVVVVSCMPVAVLGLAAALTHLLRLPADEKPEREQLLPAEFTDKISAAEVAYRRSVAGGNPLKPYALATRFEIPRPKAAEIVAKGVPAGVLPAPAPAPAGASPNGRAHG